MNSDRSIVEELEKRVARVEGQNRRLKRTGAAGLIVVALLVIMGQTSSKKTVEANEFILRDGAGNVRARLSMNESLSNSELVLFDEKGGTRIKVEGGNGLSGGVVSVFDSRGELRGLISGPGFGGHISLLDSAGHPMTTISAGDMWVAGGIRLEDDNGFAAWIGKTGLLYEGEAHPASAASVILVDNPHRKVQWKAP